MSKKQGGVSAIFSISGEKRTKKYGGTAFSFYEMRLDGHLHRICFCHDADCFSEGVLRSLLLSEKGEHILCATAISFSETSVMIKSVSLDE